MLLPCEVSPESAKLYSSLAMEYLMLLSQAMDLSSLWFPCQCSPPLLVNTGFSTPRQFFTALGVMEWQKPL